MIKTSTQLKALVKNKTKGNSLNAQIMFRHYIMERYLERLAVSDYKDLIIIKGGVLIASMIGIDKRSTFDVDATIKSLNFEVDTVYSIVLEIININLEDNILFEINSVETIMGDFEYPGIRFSLEAKLDKMKTPLKLDFSTNDVITPNEITYNYPLLFEDRSIPIMSYNIETILSEKFETIISRGTLNTRMRDYYDVYILLTING
ncbi:MAG: nucleotidyl transferase AbiEii/AbiGii toxin family protein, partial [Erysipelothrix sp.]|nr:nucleotidyl transferase AbiEii/AbiGii toxin family protein [Erysipelothrix sp.]